MSVFVPPRRVGIGTAISKNMTTTQLSLSGCKMDIRGITALARSATLCVLRLTRCDIYDSDVAILAGSTSISSLLLEGNNVGPQGAKILAKSTVLEKLDLAERVGDEGAIAFAEGRISRLFLRAMDLKATTVRALLQNESIMELGVPHSFNICPVLEDIKANSAIELIVGEYGPYLFVYDFDVFEHGRQNKGRNRLARVERAKAAEAVIEVCTGRGLGCAFERTRKYMLKASDMKGASL